MPLSMNVDRAVWALALAPASPTPPADAVLADSVAVDEDDEDDEADEADEDDEDVAALVWIAAASEAASPVS